MIPLNDLALRSVCSENKSIDVRIIVVEYVYTANHGCYKENRCKCLRGLVENAVVSSFLI